MVLLLRTARPPGVWTPVATSAAEVLRVRCACVVATFRRIIFSSDFRRHFASLRASTITSTAASTTAAALAVTADDDDAYAKHPRRSGDGRLEPNDARTGSLQADVLGIKRLCINKLLPDGL